MPSRLESLDGWRIRGSLKQLQHRPHFDCKSQASVRVLSVNEYRRFNSCRAHQAKTACSPVTKTSRPIKIRGLSVLLSVSLCPPMMRPRDQKDGSIEGVPNSRLKRIFP